MHFPPHLALLHLAPPTLSAHFALSHLAPPHLAPPHLAPFPLPHPQVPWSSGGYGLTLSHGRMSTIISTVQEDSAAQVGGGWGARESCDSHMTSTQLAP